jgi:hypothetical protein
VHRGLRRLVVAEAARGELTHFQKERAQIDQALHALAGQKLAARGVPLAASLAAAERGRDNPGSQIVDKRPMVRGIGGEGAAVNIDGTGQFGPWRRFRRVRGGLQSCQ